MEREEGQGPKERSCVLEELEDQTVDVPPPAQSTLQQEREISVGARMRSVGQQGVFTQSQRRTEACGLGLRSFGVWR